MKPGPTPGSKVRLSQLLKGRETGQRDGQDSVAWMDSGPAPSYYRKLELSKPKNHPFLKDLQLSCINRMTLSAT